MSVRKRCLLAATVTHRISRQSVGDQVGHAAIEGAPELSESGSDRGQSVGNQSAISRQSGARQRSLRVDPLFAERNIIKPFRQQFGVERSEWGPKLKKRGRRLRRPSKNNARQASEGMRQRRSTPVGGTFYDPPPEL